MDDQINLIDGLNTSQILVGLDLGTKTIGVAVSDRLKIIASPLITIERNGIKKIRRSRFKRSSSWSHSSFNCWESW